jgi:AcrR family transcriptional regulator
LDLLVSEEQRSRLLWAMLEELAEHGYETASLGAVLRRSGTPAAEFEAEFGDKERVAFAAYELLGKLARDATRSGCEAGEASWPGRVREGLAALLGAIAARPELALVATRTFPAIGPAAYERYSALVSSFVPYVREGRDYATVSEPLPADVELLAVGAAEAIIFAEVEAGRAEALPKMLGEILFSVLVPFVGPERASEEMREAAGP